MSEEILIEVRRAEPKDAASAADVMRRSIRELCASDHRNDSGLLSEWLDNKTAEQVQKWINHGDSFCVTALSQSGEVVGFGMISKDGDILLCYVAPEVVHQGYGKAILQALENQAREWGLKRIYLESTSTAKAFYERNGYSGTGKPVKVFESIAGYSMEKYL